VDVAAAAAFDVTDVPLAAALAPLDSALRWERRRQHAFNLNGFFFAYFL
jgi:hypothetical protein